jgi:hypothetical protein
VLKLFLLPKTPVPVQYIKFSKKGFINEYIGGNIEYGDSNVITKSKQNIEINCQKKELIFLII